MDFYETQKRKSKEEDDYYYSNPSSYDTTQRSLINMDDSLSSSPPPPYSSKTIRTNENTQKSLIKLNGSPSPPPPYPSKPLRSNENRSNLTKDRRPSYEKAVADGTFNVSPNDNNRFAHEYSEPQKPQPYTQVILHRPTNNDTYNNAPQYPTSRSNWESIEDDLMTDSRPKNPNQRGNDSKIKQGQENSVRIPVQLRKTTSPSNLIDFERETKRIRPCIVCKRYFEDLLSTGLCTDCDFNVKNTRGRQPVIIRSSATNNYSSPYLQSDFITPLSTTIKTRGPQKIACPHCKNLNFLNSIRNGVVYNCSVCQTILQVPRY